MRKTLLIVASSALALSYFSLDAKTAEAAIFDLTFDNTFDNNSGITPPIVGTGTFSYDGTATAGVFSFDSLINPQFTINFVTGETFTTDDIVTPLSNVEVIITNIGSILKVAFGGSGQSSPFFGSLDFVNSADAALSLEPNFFDPPLDQYFTFSPSGSSLEGTYDGVVRDSSVSTPEPLPCLIGVGAAVLLRRKPQKLKLKQ